MLVSCLLIADGAADILPGQGEVNDFASARDSSH